MGKSAWGHVVWLRLSFDKSKEAGRLLTSEDGVGEERRSACPQDWKPEELNEPKEIEQVEVDLRQLPLRGAEPVPAGATQRLDLACDRRSGRG